jgi:hypothetical protein
MIFRKTFWMNIVGATGWLLICVLSYLAFEGLDEHTTRHNIISAILRLGVIATPTVTALYLHFNSEMLGKLALFGNWFGLTAITWYCLVSAFKLESTSIFSYIAVGLFLASVFVPCVINLKAIKATRTSKNR